MSRRSGSSETTALVARSVRGATLLLSCTVGITATGVGHARVNPVQCDARFGTPGMVSYWTFDDPANPGKDDAGSHDATPVGGAMQVATGQRVGAGAMHFSGGTDHLRLDYPDFRKASTDSFSMSAWFRADDFSGVDGNNIFSVGGPCGLDDGTFRWSLLVSPPPGNVLTLATGRFCQINNNGPTVAVQAATWVHAVGVYDAGVILVYVDGIQQGSGSFTLGSTPAPWALVAAIGNDLGDPAARGFHGLIDEVAFFDRALTAEEIQGLYDSGVAGRNYCETSCSDRDGDGFGSPGSHDCPEGDLEDCNDSDPATFPGAAERCDGIDNDCNRVTPGNELDEDRDGVRVCAGDCNDRSASTRPGAQEVFDGQDNDCDGLIDENLDDDKDGVPNLKDACPGTPAGRAVGPNGCPVCDRAIDRHGDHDSGDDSDDDSHHGSKDDHGRGGRKDQGSRGPRR